MVRVNVQPNGRLILPATLRKSLGVEKGGQIMAEVIDGEVRLTTPDAALNRARAIFRQYVPVGTSVVDDVIADRRAERERETGDAPANGRDR